MSSNPGDTDPDDPDDVHDIEMDDDWGDAAPVIHGRDGRASILPGKREPVEREAVVKVIDSEETAPQQDDQPTPDEPAAEEARPAKRLEVQEFSGQKSRAFKPEPSKLSLDSATALSHNQAMSERWEIEEREWRNKQSFQPKWVAGVTIGVIGLILLCLALLPLINRANAPGSTEKYELEAVQNELMGRDQLMERLVLASEEAKQIYAEFMTGETVAEVLPLLRNANLIEHAVRQRFQAGGLPDGWTPPGESAWQIDMVNSRPFGYLTGELPNFQEFTAYFVIERGQLMLDWKATTGYSSASYDDLYQGRGNAAEVRGFLSPEKLYTVAFPESDYASFRLESPGRGHVIWCYVPKDSEASQQLFSIFRGGELVKKSLSEVKITLGLIRGPDLSLANQWLIERVHCEDWVGVD